MSEASIIAFAITWLVLALGSCLAWQLLRQNGRILLRLEELEQRLEELEFAEPGSAQGDEAHLQAADSQGLKPEVDREPGASATASRDSDGRAARFRDRSLARSRIQREGLKAGIAAPRFRLPRLEGGELSLEEFRGKRLLLVFSDPHCAPCNVLAPHLQEFHRENAETSVVVISRGDPKDNRARAKEHGWTFPVVLQRQWEISRRYAMFATPIAYLIDEAGIIVRDVAVGVEPILALLAEAGESVEAAGVVR